MRVSISLDEDDVVFIQARAEDSGIIGDLSLEIAPGQTVFGVPYETWRNHAGKTVDLEKLRREAGAVTHR